MPHSGKPTPYPRNANELNVLKQNIKKSWENNPSEYLKSIMSANENLIKQIELRNQVLQEIINERKRHVGEVPDIKFKQFVD
jgi:hypothetical protein